MIAAVIVLILLTILVATEPDQDDGPAHRDRGEE
jgi:hypothetical protein